MREDDARHDQELVHCPKCLRRVLRSNLAQHIDRPTCRVTASNMALEKAGLRHIPKSWHDTLRTLKIPLRRAPDARAFLNPRSGEISHAAKVVDGLFAATWVACVIATTELTIWDRNWLLGRIAKQPEAQQIVTRISTMRCPCHGEGIYDVGHTVLVHFLADMIKENANADSSRVSGT